MWKCLIFNWHLSRCQDKRRDTHGATTPGWRRWSRWRRRRRWQCVCVWHSVITMRTHLTFNCINLERAFWLSTKIVSTLHLPRVCVYFMASSFYTFSLILFDGFGISVFMAVLLSFCVCVCVFVNVFVVNVSWCRHIDLHFFWLGNSSP